MPAVISKFNTTSYPVNYQTPQTRRGFRILGFGLELARNESEAGVEAGHSFANAFFFYQWRA